MGDLKRDAMRSKLPLQRPFSFRQKRYARPPRRKVAKEPPGKTWHFFRGPLALCPSAGFGLASRQEGKGKG